MFHHDNFIYTLVRKRIPVCRTSSKRIVSTVSICASHFLGLKRDNFDFGVSNLKCEVRIETLVCKTAGAHHGRRALLM